MAHTAYLPIIGDRYGAVVRHIFVVGLDLTGIDMRAQVRLYGDVPGSPLVDLVTVTNGNAQGLRLVEVASDDIGIPTSHVELVINESTMEALPYAGEIGDVTTLAWDWQVTIAGRKRRLAKGEFQITGDGVTGAEIAPTNRVAPYGLPQRPVADVWSSARMTFGEEQVTVQIDGADLIAPLAKKAQAAADSAQVDRAGAELAASTALAASRYFPSRATGEAASGTNQLFSTDDGVGNLIYYRKTASGSIEIGRAVTPAFLNALVDPMKRKLDHVIYVTDPPFNAKGDGVTDNRAAIVAAEAAAYASGKTLFFPVGRYGYNGRLPLRVSCAGAGRFASVLVALGSSIDAAVTNQHPATGSASDIQFRALGFDGNGRSRGTHFIGGARVAVEDCAAFNCLVGGITFYYIKSPASRRNVISDISYDSNLIAADGIFFGDCRLPIAEYNTISAVERIGIVADSVGESYCTTPHIVGNTIFNTSNCDKSIDEYNAAIWLEVTNGGIIRDNHCSDIAGNPGQKSSRVHGIVVHTVGDTYPALTECSGNTVEMSDSDNPLQAAYVIGGSGQRAAISFGANIARYCSRGLEIAGGTESLEVRRFTVDGLKRRTITDGAIVFALERDTSEVTIDGLRVVNAIDAVPTHDWGDVHLASAFENVTVGSLTIRNIHDVHILMTTGNSVCTRLFIEGCSLLFGAQSNIFALSALHVTVSDTSFTYTGRGFAGLMNHNTPSGVLARWFFSNTLFLDGMQDIVGAGGIEAMWSGCTFRGGGVRTNFTANASQLLRFSDCLFDEYPAEGAIKANFSSTVTGYRLRVRGCEFIRSVAATPIKLWNASPASVILSNNSYTSGTLTDMTTTSVTDNIAG